LCPSLNQRWKALPDMTRRELFTLVPLLLIVLLVGVYPLIVLHLQDPAIQALLHHIKL
jgi:NADH:ubiquinone oxidoreductase subunit 4 (subunit M)